jgi:hypothetical protein
MIGNVSKLKAARIETIGVSNERDGPKLSRKI